MGEGGDSRHWLVLVFLGICWEVAPLAVYFTLLSLGRLAWAIIKASQSAEERVGGYTCSSLSAINMLANGVEPHSMQRHEAKTTTFQVRSAVSSMTPKLQLHKVGDVPSRDNGSISPSGAPLTISSVSLMQLSRHRSLTTLQRVTSQSR